MAKNAHRTTILCLFAGFWLLTALVPAYGAGSRDAELSRADQLIDEKEYDQAITLLTNYARNNPYQFAQAQTRLNKIYKIREEFNKTADTLLKTLIEDPKNDEKILALIKKLGDLEKENSPILVDFLTKVEEVAIFNMTRNDLMYTLEVGRRYLDAGDYEGALNTYAGGMEIMRDEFYRARYGATVHNQTRQETENINATIAAFNQTAAQLEAITTEFANAVSAGQHTRVPEIMTRLVPVMDRYIAQNQNLHSAAAVFERHLLALQRANRNMGDRNHLAINLRVIYGRTDQNVQEGILGVFDAFWKKATDPCIDAVTGYVESVYGTGLANFTRQDYTASINTLSAITTYSNITSVFFDKHRQLMQATSVYLINFEDNLIARNDLIQYLQLASIYESSTALSQAAVIPSRERVNTTSLTGFRERRLTVSQAFAMEQQTRDTLLGRQRELETIRTRATHLDTQISAYRNYPYIKNAMSAIEVIFSAVRTEVNQSAQRYYTLARSELENNLAQRNEQFKKGKALMEGDLRYPTEALLELSPMVAALNNDINSGNTLLDQLKTEPTSAVSNTDNRTYSTRFQTIVNELAVLRTQGAELEQTAASHSAQANALRQEGERLYAEAQTALQRQNFDTARDRIESASGRLDESLALQESASVRQFRDTTLVRLGQQIAVAQNEFVISQVRSLINTARDLYFSGKFHEAEENLLRARSRWRIINAEENEEVVYWLSMVQQAMSASSLRVITSTAPLYPEISQLLSQARRNYEEGTRLINAGQRTLGLAKFDEARVQTREVKLMFPVNQEAGILELRMEQFTDPRAFNEAFEQRLQTAIAGTKQKSIEAYADLLNLAEINPSYPRIRNIVSQAEVDMGMRPPPPNPQDIARARELTASASRILESNIITQFDIALRQINEAITLDPSNMDAPRIKDRLLNRMNTTETSAVVLSSEDEARYQQAIRELQAGNSLTAYALVERILQNPRNRNVPKVVDLQRRIQVTL